MSARTSPASSLSALQQRMQDHVLSGNDAALADVHDSGAISAERRLGIYHHAYRARLLETMRDTFGHTLRYLGDEWFDHLARAFIECTPSASSNLRWYGRSWPQWLALQLNEASPMGSHPEVPELAELDWALRRALLTLRCNTLSLWHALDDDAEVPQAEALPEPMAVLVWRCDERPHFRSMTPMEAYAMGLLTQGQSFADMCASMAAQFTDEDTTPVAGALLRRWVEEGALAFA